MKKTKILLTLVCALLLVAASVMGTLAYLKDKTDFVVNTFTVGNVKFDPDPEMHGGLDEADVTELGEYEYTTDDDGQQVKADRVTENTYKLLPGHTYIKDPTVHLSSESEKCYLFVTVTNPITDIEGDTTIADQMEAKGWKEVDAANGVYVYCGTTTTEGTTAANTTRKVLEPKTVKDDCTIVVFDNFTVEEGLDYTTLKGYANKQITVKAYIIQADGLTDTTAYTDAAVWALANPTEAAGK